MQLKLPKTDREYQEILKDTWGIDIDKDELIGKYSPSKNGTQGFFTNCSTTDGKQLKYPEDNYPLRILIWANPIKLLKAGVKYKFKVQFAAIDKRIQLNPFLLVTQRDCIEIVDCDIDLDKVKSINDNSLKGSSQSLDSVIKDIYDVKLNQNDPNNLIDMAESVEALAIDIYSENKRFIYELIQNADDAAVEDHSELVIEVKSGFVVLSHNGKPFDERDLRGLCGIGRGTKRGDEAKTGYKGIGFKSVFGQQDGLLYVKTNDLLFRFDRNYILNNGWNPRWGDQEIWEKTNQVEFKSPWQLIPILSDSTNNADVDFILNSEEFTVKTAIKIRNESKLAYDINELFSDARFILFLRKIHKVTLVHGNNKFCIEKKSDDEIPGILSIFKNDNNISNWYLRTGSYNIPIDIKKELQEEINTPKKLQEMNYTELSFAFKLEANLKSISLLPSYESFIFTYLPTSVSEFGFPFLVNSNFLVDAGREKLHKDRIWNKWLFEVIGRELLECCAEFAASPIFKDDYLKILVMDYLPENDDLKKRFNEGLKIGFKEVPFIVNNHGHLVKISDIIIDEVEIITSNIIPIKFLIQFINDNSGLSRIAEQNMLQSFSGSDKLKYFGAKTFSHPDLKVFIKSDTFLSNHQIHCNYNLLRYLKQLDANDLSGEWNSIIRNTSFVFSNKNKLEKIPLVCFPVGSFVTDYGAGNTLINQEIYNSLKDDATLIDWLISVNVVKPSEIAYLEKEIIGKIDTCISEENFLDISEFILKLHIANEIGELHYNGLRDLLLKSNKGWDKAKDCFLPPVYNPTIDFPSNIEGLTTVSEEYIGRYNAFEWKTLFVAIGVADDINILTNYKIQNTDEEFGGLFFDAAVAYGKEGHEHPNLVNTNLPQNYPAYITYFSFLTKTTQFKFSTIFWDRLISKYSLSIEPNMTIYNSHGPNRDAKVYKLNSTVLKTIDLMGWGYYERNRVCIPSFIFWYLDTKQCIPTNRNVCMLASDVFTNSDKIIELGGGYIPIINVDKVLSNEWIQFIGLKSKLNIKDILYILSSINNDTNVNGFFKRDNIKRLGLLYNEIINIIKDLTIQEEKEIKDWAKKNKFLCNDFVSRSAKK
jgi:hypothetical protein